MIDFFEQKEWFSSRKWGMFNHFINIEKSNWRNNGIAYKDFNERVNNFDVKQYARTVYELNAGYVFFTLMQCHKYICAPNYTFNQITGLKTGEGCSERDLIADLIEALDKYDIPLFLYYTGDGPLRDKEVGEKMGHIEGGEPVNSEFCKNWSAVMEEYAKRYGKSVHGWWVDGCYDRSGYSNENKLLKYYADAAKSGNPDSLIAFNNGVVRPLYNLPEFESYYPNEDNPQKRIIALWKAIQNGDDRPRKAFDNIPGASIRYSDFEDFCANESNEFEEECKEKYVDGSLWHKLSFLGIPTYDDDLWGSAGWNMPGCKYSGEYMKNYVSNVNKVGGVISIDTCLFDDGTTDRGQYEVLKYLSDLR